MKSDIDIKDDVYKVIAASELKSAVTGMIYKRERKLYMVGSPYKEDICISILSNQTSQKQEAFVNINIYVQDDDVNGQMEEKSARLKQLCQLSFKVFEYVHGTDFRLSLSKQTVVPNKSTNEHIINNKLLYQTIND